MNMSMNGISTLMDRDHIKFNGISKNKPKFLILIECPFCRRSDYIPLNQRHVKFTCMCGNEFTVNRNEIHLSEICYVSNTNFNTIKQMAKKLLMCIKDETMD